MSFLLRNAGLITLDPPEYQRGDLRIETGSVSDRGAGLQARSGEEEIDLSGKLVMPGMVCAHTHLYSALARGMPGPPRLPGNFREVLELVWWRLDRALDEETIYWSALAGAAEAALSGTTCLFDHHASPGCIKGSLDIVRRALEEVGLRAVLCYEITDRGTRHQRDDGVEENRAFLEWTRRQPDRNFRALVGAHASFTLEDDSLRHCADLMRVYDTGLHIHAAEDCCDVEDTRSRFGKGVVERLAAFGALNDHTILAHGTHLEGREIEATRAAGAWLAHNPRSNMNNRVGYAPVKLFGNGLALGTDGIGADMFEEARFAFFKSSEEGLGLDADYWLRALASNQRLASNQFGVDLRRLSPGSAADLIILDDVSPTPITAENLASHFLFGFSSASVESVMVAGKFIIRDRKPSFDATRIREGARLASRKLWDRMAEL